MKKKIILMSIFTALFVFMGVYINELNSYLYSAIGIVSGWAFVFISKQNLEIRAENTSLLAQLDTLKEMYKTSQQNAELLRQKYSRTNQPRSGGKFVKKTKQVSVLSLKQICENNLGVARPSEMSNGEISKVCGYSLNYDCLIFGLDSYAGFTTFPDTSVIFNEYKSYEYGRL